MNSLGWYVHRLSKMPPVEVPHRILHKWRYFVDKRRFVPGGALNNFHDATPLSANIYDLYKLGDYLREKEAGEETYSKVLQRAELFLSNRFEYFGLTYEYGERIDWHLDVHTKKRWPVVFCADVPYRDGSRIGGVKVVWEINRLDFLPLLGVAYRITGKKRFAEKIIDIIVDWQRENPYPYGVNWTSGIELGVRVCNVLFGLSCLRSYHLQVEELSRINAFFYSHAMHLFRYQSKHSSNNNHAIAEAFGLFLVGLYFSHFQESESWFALGKTVLERECLRQLLADGGSIECTTTYLSFVFDFFLLYKLICEQENIEYDQSINERLESSCDYVSKLMDSEGNLPNIGDQDSAVLLNFALDNHENFQSILNTGSVLFHRPEFRRPSFPDLKTCALLGASACRQTDVEQKNSARHVSFSEYTLFRNSGQVVVRGKGKGHSIVFVGNANSLGMPPLYAHGHQDALSFYLSVDGVELIVDPGTYQYHEGGRWRDYFRSTGAHNTIRINGAEMTSMPGPFMYGRPYEILSNSIGEIEGKIVWQAAHNAYSGHPDEVECCRKVVWNPQEATFAFEDEVVPKKGCNVELFFHFHPDCEVFLDGAQAIVVAQNLKALMRFDSCLEPCLYTGSHEPLAGWFSKSYNHIQKTNTLVCQTRLSSRSVLSNSITIL